MNLLRRWWWLVTLPLVLITAIVVVSLVYLRRDFLREVEEDARWPLRVAQADIEGRRSRWVSSARSTAAMLATDPDNDEFTSTVLASVAVDGSRTRVVPVPDPFVATQPEMIATVRCGAAFCVEASAPVRRQNRTVATVVVTVPITDSAFRALDVPGPSLGSRVTILHRQGDSVFMLATASHDSIALRARTMAWAAVPRHVQQAFDARTRTRTRMRTRTGRADTGLVRSGVVYASASYPDLGWVVLREVDAEELIDRLLAPLSIQLLVISSLLLFALGFARSRRREALLRRERALAEVRGDFVAAVSHELRTPLAQITLFAELLRKGTMRGPEEHARALHVIEKEASRLSILVDNVLNHARLGRTGRTRSTRSTMTGSATTAVGRDISHVLEAFAPLAADRGVRVVALDVESPAVASVDSQAVRQILLNFLENAVKYGPRGQTVTVGVREHRDAVCVFVSDQGPGVPIAERETIWTAFARGSAASASRAGGSGIGLSVVRDLVEQYGGSVGVTNTDGGGARFEAIFPR